MDIDGDNRTLQENAEFKEVTLNDIFDHCFLLLDRSFFDRQESSLFEQLEDLIPFFNEISKASKEFGDGSCKIGSCCDIITDKNRLCYRANCYATTRELVKQLNIPEGKYQSTFQSRLDDKWLKPYSDKVIEDLAKKGIKNILVFSPAFVAFIS